MKKDLNVEIGARIKEKRRNCKYTREKLAELADISPQFLADIESGKKGMSFLTLIKLCECLGVSCDYVILGKESGERQGRIYELLDNVDEKYIPLLETILDDALHLITVVRKADK